MIRIMIRSRIRIRIRTSDYQIRILETQKVMDPTDPDPEQWCLTIQPSTSHDYNVYRAKLMILGVWSISFVICFPPLVGWDSRQHLHLKKCLIKNLFFIAGGCKLQLTSCVCCQSSVACSVSTRKIMFRDMQSADSKLYTMDQISVKTPNPKCQLFFKRYLVKVLGSRCLSVWGLWSPPPLTHCMNTYPIT